MQFGDIIRSFSEDASASEALLARALVQVVDTASLSGAQYPGSVSYTHLTLPTKALV